jgi:hypothetical protein
MPKPTKTPTSSGTPAAGFAEQAHRDQRLEAGPPLGQQEQHEPDDADAVAGQRHPRPPAPLAALLRDDEQRHEADDERDGAPPVDAVVDPGVRGVQLDPHPDERGDPDGHVDEEHPPPAGDAEQARRVGEPAAHDRAQDARRTEDRQEEALVAGAVPRRHDVADDRQGQREQAAGADALDGPEGGEHVHRCGRRARGRPDDEDRDGEQEEAAPTVDVGELAVERRRDRGGDQVRRGRPRLPVQPAEVVGDGADRRGHDRLVERGEEHPRHEGDEDLHHGGVVGVIVDVMVHRVRGGPRGGGGPLFDRGHGFSWLVCGAKQS